MVRKLTFMLALVGLLSLVTAPTVGAARPAQATDLTDIPVTGTLAGGTFAGLLDITNLALQNGQLVASGVLTGTATVGSTVTNITQTFTNIPLGLVGAGTGAACDILSLDLGPLNLDVLGLVVDLSAVDLDITAVPGAGNLLGNLLCAVAGLLDGGLLGGPLGNLLNAVVAILNSLLGV